MISLPIAVAVDINSITPTALPRAKQSEVAFDSIVAQDHTRSEFLSRLLDPDQSQQPNLLLHGLEAATDFHPPSLRVELGAHGYSYLPDFVSLDRTKGLEAFVKPRQNNDKHAIANHFLMLLVAMSAIISQCPPTIAAHHFIGKILTGPVKSERVSRSI